MRIFADVSSRACETLKNEESVKEGHEIRPARNVFEERCEKLGLGKQARFRHGGRVRPYLPPFFLSPGHRELFHLPPSLARLGPPRSKKDAEIRPRCARLHASRDPSERDRTGAGGRASRNASRECARDAARITVDWRRLARFP